MLLTVTFEVGLGHWAFGYSWAQIAADYNLFQGRLMAIGSVLLLFAPLIAPNAFPNGRFTPGMVYIKAENQESDRQKHGRFYP